MTKNGNSIYSMQIYTPNKTPNTFNTYLTKLDVAEMLQKTAPYDIKQKQGKVIPFTKESTEDDASSALHYA
jgi:hypothetical protein